MFICRFVHQLSLGRAMCRQRQTELCSREGVELVSGGAIGCGRESSIPSLCRVVRGGGWLFSGNDCHDISHHLVPPRHVILGSCLRSPSTGGPPLCLLARPQAFHKCHGALLPRSPEPYAGSLHCRVVRVFEVLQEFVPTVRVEGAREL